MSEEFTVPKFFGGAMPYSADRPHEGYEGVVYSTSDTIAVLPQLYRTESGAKERAKELADVLCELWAIAPFALPSRPAHGGTDEWVFDLWAYQSHQRDLGRTLDRLQNNVRKWRHRARKAGSFGTVRLDQWLDALREVGAKCPSCGESAKLTCDHVEPLCKGGYNWPENVQPLCRGCNSSKGHNATRFVPAMAVSI